MITGFPSAPAWAWCTTVSVRYSFSNTFISLCYVRLWFDRIGSKRSIPACLDAAPWWWYIMQPQCGFHNASTSPTDPLTLHRGLAALLVVSWVLCYCYQQQLVALSSLGGIVPGTESLPPQSTVRSSPSLPFEHIISSISYSRVHITHASRESIQSLSHAFDTARVSGLNLGYLQPRDHKFKPNIYIDEQYQIEASAQALFRPDRYWYTDRWTSAWPSASTLHLSRLVVIRSAT